MKLLAFSYYISLSFLGLVAFDFFNLSKSHHLTAGWLNAFEIQLQSVSFSATDCIIITDKMDLNYKTLK